VEDVVDEPEGVCECGVIPVVAQMVGVCDGWAGQDQVYASGEVVDEVHRRDVIDVKG
jgi:hypothetical protein